MLKNLAIVGFVALNCLTLAAPTDDQVLTGTMPDYPAYDFNMYSGYLPITASGLPQGSLHYQFVESQNDPTKDPLVIWFNGGPGCSSMLAFIQEHGPFVIDDGEKTFKKNDYSWNKNANVLYIESPAGVGFSVCKETTCSYTDVTSAQTNLEALKGWFSKFPEYKSHELYLSGESYAGIYVPTLADQVMTWNNATATPAADKINLKGFMVGNGCTNWKYDTTPAFVEMAYWHGLYNDEMYDELQKNKCDYSPLAPAQSDACNAWMAKFETLTKDTNIYDVYGICWKSNDPDHPSVYQGPEIGITKTDTGLATYKKVASNKDYTPWAFSSRKSQQPKRVSDLPPCVFGNPLIAYFNRADVKAALHIDAAVTAWDLCNSGNNFAYETDYVKGSQWVWEKYRGQLRMLKYSGDKDGAVPTQGTREWIRQLNWNVTTPYHPWEVNGQVGGYLEERDGMTFSTVHGAGHMAPQQKRPETWHLIFNWLNGTAI